jgi:ABC-2 type transport system ATP-binding protein
MSDAVIDIRGTTKSYPGKAVLKGVDLTVPRGSVTGLLGKNGSGKTTMIKCLLGLVKPQAGSITVLEEPAWTLSAGVKARLGYVPQVPAHYPYEWELKESDRVGTLSVGQAQKLSILLALGHEPDLLVFDEPVASLDPAARRQFLRTVLDIAGAGERTVLFSTHITSDLERVADRVAILKDGRMIHAGELDHLKDDVKRLRVSAERPIPEDFQFPGLLRREGRR